MRMPVTNFDPTRIPHLLHTHMKGKGRSPKRIPHQDSKSSCWKMLIYRKESLWQNSALRSQTSLERREKTQAKIARVIKELGYVPNAQAQTLTGKQTHVIAIIILDNTNKWAGLVLNGMEQVMLPAGYQTVVCTSNFNPETELMYVDKMLSLGVDGFIIQPTANFKAASTQTFFCLIYPQVPETAFINTISTEVPIASCGS